MSIEVLLVDEDTDVLEIVQTFLEQEDDLDVTSQADPETALDMALADDYDVVVSDFVQKGTGTEQYTVLAEKIRAAI